MQELEFDIKSPDTVTSETSTKSMSTLLDEDELLLRESWTTDNHCMIFSRSAKRFYLGRIDKIWTKIDTGEEWLLVHYNGRKKKEVQRFCPNIMSLEMAIQLYDEHSDKFAAISFPELIEV